VISSSRTHVISIQEKYSSAHIPIRHTGAGRKDEKKQGMNYFVNRSHMFGDCRQGYSLLRTTLL
jgi:hypothetical protein